MSSCHCEIPDADRSPRVLGDILLADDEETFLHSTADLLRDEGYHCECVGDAESALRWLRAAQFDLLIADIKMPGNPKLELVQEIAAIAAGMPVILVTGYPSLKTAIASIRLPVVGYYPKPIELNEFIPAVAQWVERSRTYRAAKTACQQFVEWNRQLERISESVNAPLGRSVPSPAGAFAATLVSNIMSSLGSLFELLDTLTERQEPGNQLQACDAAWSRTLIQLLREVVDVLHKTKGAFKSKQLGQLRHRVQVVLDRWDAAQRQTEL